MATINKNLEALTKDDVIRISEQYLMGWHDLEKEYGFRIKGLNNKRVDMGMDILDKNISLEYRLSYIKSHYSQSEIYDAIKSLLMHSRTADDRWSGIELFECRFGRDYVRAFRSLIGSSEYRQLAEECRIAKLSETQISKYGGVGLAGNDTMAKAVETNKLRYGVSNPMQSDAVKSNLLNTNADKYGGMSPFNSKAVRDKAIMTRTEKVRAQMDQFKQDEIIKNLDCFKSEAEKIVFTELVSRFGRSDVFYEYGIHPFDKRYPFNCDFYIKSLDLFIEMNGHYSHHTHWFDANNSDDVLRRKNMLATNKRRSINAIKVWCETDVKKRKYAADNKLKYLVFWDGSIVHVDKKQVPALRDFYEWFNKYDCDTDAFLKDHPGNTY